MTCFNFGRTGDTFFVKPSNDPRERPGYLSKILQWHLRWILCMSLLDIVDVFLVLFPRLVFDCQVVCAGAKRVARQNF